MNCIKYMNKSFLSVFMSLLIFLICHSAGAVTLDELRQIAADTEEIQTARMVCIREMTEDSNTLPSIPEGAPLNENERALHEIVLRLKRNLHSKVEAIYDYSNKRSKFNSLDLRDLNELIADSNLSQEEAEYVYVNACRTGITIFENDLQLMYDEVIPGRTGTLTLMLTPAAMVASFEETKDVHVATSAIPEMDLFLSRRLSEDMLNDELNPTLTEVEVDGRNLVQLECDYLLPRGRRHPTLNPRKRILLDPQFNYSPKKVENICEDRISGDITFDNYKEVNGIYYPFSQVMKVYKSDGDVHHTDKFKFEKAEFNIDVNDADFKIDVPAGTVFDDYMLTYQLHNIEEQSRMGVKDAVQFASRIMMKSP